MTDKKKKDSPRKLFVDRMKREERFSEYREKYRDYMKNGGLPFLKAQYQTMLQKKLLKKRKGCLKMRARCLQITI
jgi:hypothetical protein